VCLLPSSPHHGQSNWLLSSCSLGPVSKHHSLLFSARTKQCYKVIHQYTAGKIFEHFLLGVVQGQLQQPPSIPSSLLAPPLPRSHLLSGAVLVRFSEGLSQTAR